MIGDREGNVRTKGLKTLKCSSTATKWN